MRVWFLAQRNDDRAVISFIISCGIHLIIRDHRSPLFPVLLTQNAIYNDQFVSGSFIDMLFVLYFNAFWKQKHPKWNYFSWISLCAVFKILVFLFCLFAEKSSALAFSPFFMYLLASDWFPFDRSSKQRTRSRSAIKLRNLFHCHALILLSVYSFFAFLMLYPIPLHTKKWKINIFF